MKKSSVVYILVIALSVLFACNKKENVQPQGELMQHTVKNPKVNLLNTSDYDVMKVKWKGKDEHLRDEEDDKTGTNTIHEKAVYVSRGYEGYDYEELVERIEELENEVEELHWKLDEIDDFASKAKSSLEDGLYFHLPGSFDEVENYLNEISWECMY